MKFATILTICLWALFIYTIGTEATPPCNKICTRESRPTCGTLRRPNGKVIQCTFSNPCVLRVHICVTRERWTATPGSCRVNSPQCREIQRAG